jgi:hypothetical protein
LDAIDQLLEAGDLEEAKRLLGLASGDDNALKVLRIKLSMYDGSLSPGAAMQRLIQIMRTDAEAPRAKQLYQEASNSAYQSRQSSVSHSHPPPPADSDDDS